MKALVRSARAPYVQIESMSKPKNLKSGSGTHGRMPKSPKQASSKVGRQSSLASHRQPAPQLLRKLVPIPSQLQRLLPQLLYGLIIVFCVVCLRHQFPMELVPLLIALKPGQ